MRPSWVRCLHLESASFAGFVPAWGKPVETAPEGLWRVCGIFSGLRRFPPPPQAVHRISAARVREPKVLPIWDLDLFSSFPQPLSTTTVMLYSGVFQMEKSEWKSVS